jgi:hypothetical protein
MHVFNATTSRETFSRPSATHITTLRILVLTQKRTASMIVARDRSAWGQRVESQFDLPPGSFTNLQALN